MGVSWKIVSKENFNGKIHITLDLLRTIIHYIIYLNAKFWKKKLQRFISGNSNRIGLFFIWPFPLWTMKSAKFFSSGYVCFSYTIFREGSYYFWYFMTLERAGGRILVGYQHFLVFSFRFISLFSCKVWN